MRVKLFKYVAGGIAWGCTIQVLVTVVGYQIMGNDWFLKAERPYPQQVAAAVLIGLAFSLPAILYEWERLPWRGVAAIHLGIGLLIYFPTAFYMGWVPVETSGLIFTFFGISIVITIFIWFAFYIFAKKEAEEMNKKIKEKL